MIRAGVSKAQVAMLIALGVLVIAVLLWIGVSSPGASCGGQIGSPATAFQFAKSATDIEHIFGSDSSQCRNALMDGLKASTLADLFLFTPLYGLFLLCFAAIMSGRTKAINAFLAAALVATIAGDVLETGTQLIILDEIENGSQYLVSLKAGSMLKIFGLACVLLGLNHALWKQGGRLGYIFGALLGMCALFRIAAFAIEPIRSLAPLSALFAYIVMLACTIGWYIQLRRRGERQSLP